MEQINKSNFIPTSLFVFFALLLRLEEFDFNTSVNNNIDSSCNEKTSESHSHDPKNPVDPPTWAVHLGPLDLEPHPTWVHQCHRQWDSSDQTSNTSEEWDCHSHEEAPESEHESPNAPKPPRQWLLLSACVFRLHVVKHGHSIYLEWAQRIYHHE